MKINRSKNGEILNTEIENREDFEKILKNHIVLAELGIRKSKEQLAKRYIKEGVNIAADWTGAETDDYSGWYWIGVIKSPNTDSYMLCFDYCGGGALVTLGFDQFGYCEDYQKEGFIKQLVSMTTIVEGYPLYIPSGEEEAHSVENLELAIDEINTLGNALIDYDTYLIERQEIVSRDLAKELEVERETLKKIRAKLERV